jgi:anaerobic nitric oxide reductase transcription regulator
MAESLLFGHRRGAFSGAVESHRGHWECADGGTLFLDELTSLPAEVQPKVLRALDSGEIHPLGEERCRRVVCRVIAAAQEDAAGRVAGGEVRADLHHRLAGVVVELPPLVARMEDVMLLAEHFAQVQGQRLESGADTVLLNYPWPGNVRELQLAVRRAACLVSNGVLPTAALAEAIRLAAGEVPVLNCPAPTREELLTALERTQRDVRRAAAVFHVGRTTFFKYMRLRGISLRALRRQFSSSRPFSELT